jgi:UDP-N-acetylmuramate: L-alanyl-gamma-D-glutamyl-meso-diaminopimelate ligase
VKILPEDGCLVARWDHDSVAEVASLAQCEVRRYGPGQSWDGRIEDVDTERGLMRFTVLHAGKRFGTFESQMVGEHNLYNQVAITAALSREGLSAEQLATGFASLRGIKRRQEIIGQPGGVTVLDDFAHHPTAVSVTLDALRLRFGGRRIWAIFEPRSNTSRRNVFQDAYAESFGAADLVVIAEPTNLEGIPVDERMDAGALVDAMRSRGLEAWVWPDADAITAQVVANAQPSDVVAVLSNGGFDGIHGKLIAGLEARFIGR